MPPALHGERGREALVERLDRLGDRLAQRADEPLRLSRLAPVLPPQGQRQPDDDSLHAFLANDLLDPVSPAGLAARSTTPNGRAIVPVASETATPVRAAP